MAYSIFERLEQADGMLTVKQVAEILNYSEKTVYRHAQAKKIPSLRLGKDIRFCPRTLKH